MSDFVIKLLSEDDGSWEAFRTDWEDQCRIVGETLADYGTDAMAVLEGIARGTTPALGGVNDTAVGAVWDATTSRYYAACVLNRTMLPKTSGYTLRVRQVIVSPLIDFGEADVRMYPDVIIGLVLGIVHLSSTVMTSNNLHMHLRSPEDVAFFRAFTAAVETRKVFASVQIRGAWLYIEKLGTVSTVAMEEAE